MSIADDGRSNVPLHEVPEGIAAQQSELFPCGYTQLRIWYSQMLDPESSHWNVAMRWRLSGNFSHETVQAAWQVLFDRHEALRTGVEDVDGMPYQRVWSKLPARVDLVNLSRLSPEDRESALERIGRNEAGKPIPLTQTPLLRLQLLRVSSDEAYLLTNFHHMIVDGWSVGVLMLEFGEVLSALEAGREPKLPDLQIQLVDYALWQSDMVAGSGLDASRAFWRERLENVPRFEVKTDKPRPPVLTYGGDIRTVLLDRAISEEVNRFCKSRNYSIFQFAAATLSSALVARVGSTDVVFGSQVACRDEPELDGLVGPLINTLVQRYDASGDPLMSDFLDHCRARTTSALSHQQLPFNFVIDEIKPKRDPSRHPVYSIGLDAQAAHINSGSMGDLRFDGLTITAMPSFSAGALTDLSFFMVGREEGWRISCAANSDLFDDATVGQMLRDWGQAIAATLLSDGRLRLSQLLEGDTSRFVVTDVTGKECRSDAYGLYVSEDAAQEAGDEASRAVQRVRSIVRDVWAETLGVDHAAITDEIDFFDAGGSSLGALRMLSRLNKRLESKHVLSTLLKAPQFGAFAAAVSGEAVGDQSQAAGAPRVPSAPLAQPDTVSSEHDAIEGEIVTPDRAGFAFQRSEPGKTPVLALNNGYAYLLIERAMSSERAVIDVPVGTDEDTEFAKTHNLAAFIGRLAERVRATGVPGPYVITSYCVLGKIAAELVRKLEDDGDKVALLVALNSRAPGYDRKLGWQARLIRKRSVAMDALSNFGILAKQVRRGDLPLSLALEHYGFVRRTKIVPALRKIGLFAKKAPEFEYVAGLDFFDAAFGDYTPTDFDKTPLNCNVAVIHTPDMTSGRYFPAASGWPDVTTGRVRLYTVPGKHMGMLAQPSAREIGKIIEALLSDMEAAKGAALTKDAIGHAAAE